MLSPKITYLSRAEVESVALDMQTIISRLEDAFLEKSQGKVEMPPKPGIHPLSDAFIHAMPAYIPSLRSAGMKWVAGFPDNARKGLPYISGLIVLNDVETGLPYAVMDCTWITAYRTGAKTAIAAKHLARPDSEVAGILACGMQGRTNLIGLASVFSLKRVYAYDVNQDAQARYIDEMRQRFDFEIVGVSEPRQAVVDSDLVVTSGPILLEPRPTIQKDWLKPGGFGSAVDYDSYWSGGALVQIDLLCTDDLPQFDDHRRSGYFKVTPEPYAELGELVAGRKPGRQDAKQRTLAMNLGLAMDDMAVAPEIYRRAQELGLGTTLKL
ncbi:MAG: ornithine cyclodeaminase family protein [Anaerolineales bacterium]|nr:ornithine cyclodeaminase family protein [Anaerolineales bacterium]